MDNLSLLSLAKSGDKEARNKLIQNNTSLVWSIASRFKDRGIDIDDIFQIGCIGMLKAINRFDESYNVKFSTYAVPLIMGEIQRFIRDDGIIKVSRSLKETAVKALRARERLFISTGREPTISEISKEIGVEKDVVLMALEAGKPPDYLHRTVGEGSDTYLLDTITMDLDTGDTLVNSLSVKMAMDFLSDEDRSIIEMRYFMGKTQREVAQHFNVSQVNISRKEKRILKTMRGILAT